MVRLRVVACLPFFSLFVLVGCQFVDHLTIDDNCSHDQFKCPDSRCIPKFAVCDGSSDCLDGADEDFCGDLKVNILQCTGENKFTCQDQSMCLDHFHVCNGVTDCDDGSDEANCNFSAINSTCHGFRCKSTGECISTYWICDGHNDCPDQSDEDGMSCFEKVNTNNVKIGNIRFCPDMEKLDQSMFFCRDRSYCIDHADLCNGVKDCRDSSDEDIFCGNWSKQCETVKSCEESCIPTPKGPQCKCGHITTSLNQTCSNVDFCKELPSTCSQMCSNGKHSYICSCDEGYRSAGNMCYALEHDPILFYTTKKEIKSYDIKTNRTILLTSAKYASSIISDGTHIYWIEMSEGNHNVMKANLDNVPKSKEVLLGIGIDEPTDLAIDWMANNIYFTEPEHNYIGVCTNTGSACSRIRNNDIRSPRLIALNPETGIMYWSDYIKHPRIQQSKMDGSNSVTLTMNRVYPPSALTVDIPNGKLYWAESEGGISVINFDGSGKYEFLAQFIYAPNCLNIFENDVYWNDQTLNVMQSSSKMEGEARRKELFKLHGPIIDASLYHPILQNKKSNPCSHSQCSHICVITSNTSYVCMCGEDSILNDDKHSCKKTVADKILLVGGSQSLTKIHFHALTKPEKESVTLNIGRIQALAYNPHEDVVYIYDGKTKVVFKYAMSKFDQQHLEVMPIEGIENIIDMSYDYMTDNLYYIDVSQVQSKIGVFSTRASHTATVHVFEDDDTTVSMCVLPEYGTLMVAVYNTKDGVVRVDRLGMDGKNHNTVFKTSYEGFQVNVRYSHLEEQIYISDSGKGLILQMHPEGTSQSNFREISTAVSSMATVDRVVFWTDKHMPRLFWANADDHVNSMGSMMMQNYSSEYHLHLVGISGHIERSNHPCVTKFNCCAHICVQSKHRFNDKTTPHTCLCPNGQVPKDEHCVKRVICPYGQLRCYDSNTCYNKNGKCDGVDNCPNGEDEMNCEEVKGCKKEEFKCPSSVNHCIAKHQLCDGHNDCADGSDEESHLCSYTPCESDMFTCENGLCIMMNHVCDNEPDCPDGSDERGCVNSKCTWNDFRCKDGQCIDIRLHCDGNKDCIDWSDEKDCMETEDILPEILFFKKHCSETEYACPSNKSICLPQSARCDLKFDCPQKEDEKDCTEVTCVPGYFRCRHGRRCISQSQVCDTSNDCEDGSDETTSACWEKKSKEQVTEELCTGFKCENGQCISSEYLCDGYNDCVDGSDENHMCQISCKTRRCHHMCLPTPQGARCLCHDGYILDENTNLCKDIDECERDICSQECTNIAGSYLCSCYEGYTLRSDRHSCKSKSDNVTFMYISERVLKVTDKYYNKIIWYSDPNVQEIIDIAYEPIKNIVYVTTTGKELLAINKDGEVTNITNIGTPTTIAADWITGNIYIVDTTINNHSMKACNLYKGLCVTILKLPAQFEIHHLSVDSINRYIFYCGTYRDSPRSVLYKVNIINMKTEALREIHICTGLTLDYHKQSVYVLQTNAVIAKISYDGSKSEIAIRNEEHFKTAVGLQLFEDYLYTIDISNLKSIKCLIFGSRRCEPDLNRLYRGGDFALIHREVEKLEAFRHCNVTCSVEDCEARPECLCYQGLDSPNDMCLNSILAVQAISTITTNQGKASSQSVLLGFSITGALLLLCCCIWVCRSHAGKPYRFDRDSWISCFKSTRRRVWSSNILRWPGRQSTKSCSQAIVNFQSLQQPSDTDPKTTGVQNSSYVTWMYTEQDSNVAIHIQKPQPNQQCCTEPRFCTHSQCSNKLIAGPSSSHSVVQSHADSASPKGSSSDTESELDIRVPLF